MSAFENLPVVSRMGLRRLRQAARLLAFRRAAPGRGWLNCFDHLANADTLAALNNRISSGYRAETPNSVIVTTDLHLQHVRVFGLADYVASYALRKSIAFRFCFSDGRGLLGAKDTDELSFRQSSDAPSKGRQ